MSATLRLGEKFLFESSERSDAANWAKRLLRSRFLIAEFEGYTIKNNRVSMLLDRARFYEKPRDWNPCDIYKMLQEHYGIQVFQLKCKFASLLKSPYVFVAYQDSIPKVQVFHIQANKASDVIAFRDYQSFAEWTKKFRDLQMLSRYEESGLPDFDKILRQHGVPWPGNLDCLIGVPESQSPKALVEFQYTSKASVKEHCNNDWFLPRGRRKGDEQRWKVLDIIRRQSEIPLWIIVWSRDRTQGVKLKVVEEIIYSGDERGRKPGLVYSEKRMLDGDALINWIERQC